ncbi:MAG TPA: proline dehydrogenase family protein [Bryobacteraceae bacterium]|jgi:proline dehydrogenase|nr:proline dehydrogenase family protein [Bryobacteraceae bacterium]
MLRAAFLYLSNRKWLRHWMENSAISRNLTSRFVAGRTLGEAIAVLQKLARENVLGTLDFLGENVTSLEEAGCSRDTYMAALTEIEKDRLPATVSIKLTQFGLDFSEDACLENVAKLIARAQSIGSCVEIDMESSVYTGRTLRIVGCLQQHFPGSLRAVIQAYLFRSEDDVRTLSSQNIPVRLCKGAYREPPNVAFAQKIDVDRNYVKLMKLLLSEGIYPAIASHDEKIVREGLRYLKERKIASDRFEFQMLYGIRRDLQRQLTAEGYRLRLYVPYGDAWYPYFMRRLAERPANVLFLARNLLRR